MASTDPTALGRTAFELVHGYTPDITLHTRHCWYEMIFWFDSLDNTQKIGRWLGPCGRLFGAGDCHFILDSTARIHVTNSTKAIPEAHWKNPDALRQMEDFNDSVLKKIGDDVKPDDAYFEGEYPDPPTGIFDGETQEDMMDATEAFIPDVDERLADEGPELPTASGSNGSKRKKHRRKKNPRRPTQKNPIATQHIVRDPSQAEAPTPVENKDEFIPDGDVYDEYLNNQVMMKSGDRRLKCVVVNRTHDLKGVPIGQRNNNPLLDTRIYDLQFPDGKIEQHTANTIAECIYSDIDDEGHTYTMMNELTNHKKDDTALKADEASYFDRSGKLHNKPTTKGWQIEVDWKDGTSSWCTLSDIKESYPVRLNMPYRMVWKMNQHLDGGYGMSIEKRKES